MEEKSLEKPAKEKPVEKKNQKRTILFR